MTHEPNSNWSQDDQDWLDLLAGRKANNAATTTRREAELLRQTILTRHTAVDDDDEPKAEPVSDQDLDHAWQRMRFRLPRAPQQQQSSQQQQPQAVTRPLRQRRSTLVAMALAATLAGVVIAPKLLISPRQPETAVKGLIQPQLLSSATPERMAQAIASALLAQGLEPQVKQQDDKWVVEAEIPAPTTELEQVLQRFSLTAPQHQQLVIWVTQSE